MIEEDEIVSLMPDTIYPNPNPNGQGCNTCTGTGSSTATSSLRTCCSIATHKTSATSPSSSRTLVCHSWHEECEMMQSVLYLDSPGMNRGV